MARSVVIAALVMGFGAMLWMLSRKQDGPVALPVKTAQAVSSTEPGLKAVQRLATPQDAPDHRLSGTPENEPSTEVTPASESPRSGVVVRGRVVDLQGSGLAGIEVCSSQGPCGRSRGDGLFLIEGVRGASTFVIRDEGYATLAAGLYPPLRVDVKEAESEEVIVVASPRVTLAGTVVDEHGTGVEGAQLTLRIPDDTLLALGDLGERVQRTRLASAAAAHGRFEFDAVPSGVVLWADAKGYRPRLVRVPPQGDDAIVVTLQSLDAAPDTVTGIVLDPNDLPVEGALVSSGGIAVTTDASGLFRFGRKLPRGLPVFGQTRAIRAVKPGFLPAQAPLPPEGSNELVVLVLSGGPLAIAGRVVDEAGEPRHDVLVTVWDRTAFGAVAEGDGSSRPADAEELLAGAANLERKTDERGAFEISGLLDREYRLEVIDEARLRAKHTEPIRAGRRDVLIKFSNGPGRGIDGRVVYRDGKPAENVEVQIALLSACEGEDDPCFGVVQGASIVTGPEGRFHFEAEGEGLVFMLQGEAIVPRPMVRVTDDGGPVELVVSRRCRLRLQRTNASEALRAEVVDAAGGSLSIYVIEGRGFFVQPALTLGVDGPPPILTVSEEAAELILRNHKGDVRRIPLTLTSDAIQDIVID